MRGTIKVEGSTFWLDRVKTRPTLATHVAAGMHELIWLVLS